MDVLGRIGDVEKPHIGCPPCAEKLPLVLSNLGSTRCIEVPASIAQHLRDYQREGVRFLHARYEASEGGILADDMGLGKTIQSIAFISAILGMTGTSKDKLRHSMDFIKKDAGVDLQAPSVSPVLIICPASLTDNWVLELQTWGHFKVLKYEKKLKSDVLNKAKRQECDVVVATLETARADITELNSVDWTAIIVDEVHRIKDPASLLTKALTTLPCKYRFGLTGTPLQNNLSELWCLLNWANPNCLGDLATFTNDVIRVVELGQRHNATKRELAEARIATVKFAAMRNRYMLRRTKALLQDQLPHKTDQVVFCELTELQSEIYRRVVESPDVKSLLAQLQDSGCGSRGEQGRVKRGTLFTYMHLLLKAANHLGLLMSSPSSCQESLAHKICKDVMGNHSKDDLFQINMSGKMQVLSQLLDRFMNQGDKVLLFSRSTQLLNVIQKHLQQRRYKYYRLDGSTATHTRCALVHTFNVSPHPSIFLLSIKAGGVGLNITGANVVIIFDPNWNPAIDLQAQDRAYRLGQVRDVRVYRLLSTSTIEELIYLRQLYKQKLATVAVSNKNTRRYFTSVSGDTRYHGELFGIKNIFSFRDTKRSLTEEILERQAHLEQDLLLQIEPPRVDEMGVNIAPYALKVDDPELTGKRSGLSELIEDMESVQFEGLDEASSEDDEEMEETEEGHQVMDSTSPQMEDALESTLDILSTSDVRHVVEHDAVTETCRAEDFMVQLAVEDVFERGIDSQRPASDCRTICKQKQLLPTRVRSKMSPAVLRRSIFMSMAKDANLTAYDFGLKVLSLNEEEKIALLRKYNHCTPGRETLTGMKKQLKNVKAKNKRQQNNNESPSERGERGEGFTRTDFEKVGTDQEPNVTQGQDDKMVLDETMSVGCNKAEYEKSHSPNRSDNLSRMASMDLIVSQCSIPRSRQSAATMDELFLRTKSPVKAPPPLSKTSTKLEPQSSTSLLDSLFFSDNKGKVSHTSKGNSLYLCSEQNNPAIASVQSSKYKKLSIPLKNDCKAIPDSSGRAEEFLEKTFFGEIEDGSASVENKEGCGPLQTTHSSASHQILDCLHFGNESVMEDASKDPHEYSANDDVFQQLLKSGKLKRL